jgi:hypothetical protein
VQVPVQSTSSNNNTSLVLSRATCFQLWNLESESYISEWMLKGYKDQAERPCGVNDTHAILVRVCVCLFSLCGDSSWSRVMCRSIECRINDVLYIFILSL